MIRRTLAATILLAGTHAWAAGSAINSDSAAATRAADITRDGCVAIMAARQENSAMTRSSYATNE